MFHILAFLFIFFLVILFIGLSIVGSIFRVIFGFGKRHKDQEAYYNAGSYHADGRGFSSTYQSTSTGDPHSSPYTDDKEEKHKKVFSKDEGEYVDYEEIKE